MPIPFQALWREYAELDFRDDRRLCDWLRRVLDTACEKDMTVTFRVKVAADLASRMAIYPDGSSEQITEALRYCQEALSTAPGACRPRELYEPARHVLRQLP